VTLTFNEPVRVVSKAVHLFAADSTELETSAVSVDDRVTVDLPDQVADGSLTLAWRVISADGHPVAGALVFAVGAPSAQVAATPAAGTTRSSQIAVGVVQALVYLGVFLAIGLLIFLRVLLPTDPRADHARTRLLAAARRGADIGFVAAVLLLPLTTINQRGDRLTAIFEARSWQIDLGNPEPVAMIMVVLGLATALLTTTHRVLQVALSALGGALALGSLAVVGHSRSFGPAPLVITSDVVHVLAGAVWLGGLVGLAISLRHLGAAPGLAASAVNRFSATAAGLLATVAVTGTILTWRILGSFEGFVTTSFGRTLLVKLALVGVVVVLAALNRWKLLPELRRRSERGELVATAAATDRLRRTVRVEGLVLIGVLAVTGVLVDRTPEPRGETVGSVLAGTTRATGGADGTRVLLELDPARVGDNAVRLRLSTRAGSALRPLEVPTITFAHGDLRISVTDLVEDGPGGYRLRVSLPEAGRWVADVTVRTGPFESRVIPVRFTTGPSPTS
jgi:copper transport protein